MRNEPIAGILPGARTVATIAMPSTYQELLENYLLPGVPVHIKNFWPSGFVDAFTPARLGALFNDDPLRVNVAPGGFFRIDSNTGGFPGSVEMPIQAILDQLGTGQGEWYLQQLPVGGQPALAASLPLPPILKDQNVDEVLFWLGANSVTALHYDFANNFLCQVHGRKLITMFEANVFEELYPYPLDSHAAHVSQVMLERPDLAAHPRLAEVSPIQLVLEAGDILFIPSCTWHQIRNDGLCASFNIWWPMLAEQTIYPGFSRSLTGYYPELPATLAQLDKAVVTDLLGFARYAQARRYFRVAAVLACAHLETTIRVAAQPGTPLPTLDIEDMCAALAGDAARDRYPDGLAASMLALLSACKPAVAGSDVSERECGALLAEAAALAQRVAPSAAVAA